MDALRPSLNTPDVAVLQATPSAAPVAHLAHEAGGTAAEIDAAPRLTIQWLVGMRWAALVSEAALIGIAARYQWLLALDTALVVLAAGVASNVALAMVSRRPTWSDSRSLLGAVLLTDVVLVWGMLTVSGGPSNPFSVVYLVYVTLAAVALGAAWTWTIVTAAAAGYATLFAWHVPLSEHVVHTGGLTSHLAGMWLAFAATASVIAFFVTGLTRTLAQRERQLAEMRLVAAKHECLASLTTLAAGAAHELATPLGSIAIAARELERLAADTNHPDLRDDAQLIRSQVDRCKLILDQMSGRANEDWVESSQQTDITDVLQRVLDGLAPDRRARCHVEPSPVGFLVAPRAGLVQALLNLVRNAFDASPPGGQVSVGAEASPDSVRFVVRDRGTGMPSAVLARAGEPFFTTKAPGAGFGLGLFLVRLFAERQGGRMIIDSTQGSGTTAILELPRGTHGHG